MKFSAVRSAVRMLPAEPAIRATATPASTFVPSGTSVSKRSDGSCSRNVSRATSTPATTPASFTMIEARAPTCDWSVFSVVMSPLPTSSDSAHFTNGNATASSMIGLAPGSEPALPALRLARAAALLTRLRRRAHADLGGGGERRAHFVDAVAETRRALELELARRFEHLALEPREQCIRTFVTHCGEQRLQLVLAAARDRVGD